MRTKNEQKEIEKQLKLVGDLYRKIDLLKNEIKDLKQKLKTKKNNEDIYVFDPYDGLQEFVTIEDAKKYIIDSCTDPVEGIHPEIETFLIMKQTHQVEVVPIDDEEVFEIRFKSLND